MQKMMSDMLKAPTPEQAREIMRAYMISVGLLVTIERAILWGDTEARWLAADALSDLAGKELTDAENAQLDEAATWADHNQRGD